ncbi:Hypothetical predicted protein [Pelobates cultripes]|nr:Hypothetical predicted protein [Pelobates cultripes]
MLLQEGLSGEQACAYSLLQYACAKINLASTDTVVAILKCFITNQDAIFSQEATSLFVSKLSLDTLRETFEAVDTQVPDSSITPKAKSFILNAVWEKLRTNPSALTSGSIAAWFQERLYGFLSAINLDILDCMADIPLTCDAFQSVVGALDLNYANFDNATQQEIGNWISRFIQINSCRKNTAYEFINSYYRSFKNSVNYSDYELAWNGIDLSAALDVIPSFQVAQYAIANNAFSSVESSTSIIEFLKTKSLLYIVDFLDSVSQLSVDTATYDSNVVSNLLEITLGKLSQDDGEVCKSSWEKIFTTKITFILTAINEATLQLLPADMDCSDYRSIFNGINLVYNKLDEASQLAVFNYRLQFLQREADKTGTACTCDYSSQQWIENNFGFSFSFFTFNQLIALNQNFNGFDAVSYLTVNQTVDLIIYSKILTEAEPQSYETRVNAVTTVLKNNGYAYLLSFIEQFEIVTVQEQVVGIANEKVRSLFLDGVWEVISTQFSQFLYADWNIWFYKYLTIFIPSIKPAHLRYLSIDVVKDCSSLQIIVQGFDLGFGYMTIETKKSVTSWIISFLTAKQCSDNNWLTVNFRQFKEYVTYTEILTLNPSYEPLTHLDELTATQISEVVIKEESARTSVAVINTVFDALTVNVTYEEAVVNLGSFWEGYNSQYKETITVTSEVQYTMLQRTTSKLAYFYRNFTETTYNFWFEQNIITVLPQINAEILNQLPLNMACSSYQSIVRSLDKVYAKTESANRDDVYQFYSNYLSKSGKSCVQSSESLIKLYLRSYKEKATYEQLVVFYEDFNIFETNVLSILTPVQIGEAIVKAKVTESIENVTQLFNFLKTVSIEEVNSCFTQFTTTGTEAKLVITSEEVGTYILENYLTIISSEITTYTEENLKLLFETRINLIINFFTIQSLSLLAVQDCNKLSIVVTELDNSFDVLSPETKQIIADWIISLIKDTTFNGCQSISVSETVWVNEVFGGFFQFVKLSEITEVYQDFDFKLVIAYASITQKVDYIVSSDAFTNVETIKFVLESLKEEDSNVSVSTLTEFLVYFNTAYNQSSDQLLSLDVKQELMDFCFSAWVLNIKFLSEIQVELTYTYFQNFISGTTTEVVKRIPQDLSCTQYRSIISSFSIDFDSLSKDVRRAIFDYIISYLSYNSEKFSGNVCSSLYRNSDTYILYIYYRFSIYATYYQLSYFYIRFNVYEVLHLLSGRQLGNLLINSTAIQNQFKAVEILVEVQKRSAVEVTEFIQEFNTVAKETGLINVASSNIQDLIFQSVYPILTSEVDISYSAVFKDLEYVISSISVSDIQKISWNGDCDEQTSVVGSFGEAFDRLSEDKRKAFYGKISENLAEAKNTRGSACSSGKDSKLWIRECFSSFIAYADLEELQQLNSNFSVISAVSELTGTQLADYLYTSGGLENEEIITQVFDSFEKTEQVYECLTQLNTIAPADLITRSNQELIIKKTLDVISVDFPGFTTKKWTDWFQGPLVKFLPTMAERDFDKFNLPLRCDNYQAILKGFNNAFDRMTPSKQKVVYDNFVKIQLNSTKTTTGVVCGDSTQRTQEWIDTNCGSFFQYAEYINIVQWNEKFTVTEVISSLSVEQLAEVTLQSSNINNEELACQVSGRLQQSTVTEVYSFLTQYNTVFQQLGLLELSNDAIRYKYLSTVIAIVEPSLSSYTVSEWTVLFSQINIFMSSIDHELSATLLGAATCDSYPIIVKNLDGVFESLSVDTQKSLFDLLYGFLLHQYQTTGSACPVPDESSSQWIERLLKRFFKYSKYTAITGIDSNFNGLQVINLLTPHQLADFAFTGNVLTNTESASALATTLGNYGFTQINDFLDSFNAAADATGTVVLPNRETSSSLLNVIYGKASAQFNGFTSDNWINFWSHKLRLFISGLTGDQINLIPFNIDCRAYQGIISTLSNNYDQLSNETKQAGFTFAKTYLLGRKQQTGSVCIPQTPGSSALLKYNLGSFQNMVSYQEISNLFQDFSFTDAAPLLDEEQLAYYSVKSGALRDTDKITSIMASVSNLDVGLFLDYFNLAAGEAGLTQLPNSQVRDIILGEVFCKLGLKFPLFSASDFTNLFSDRLKFFTSGLSSKTLGFINTDISCDSLAAIVQSLNDVVNLEHSQDIYNFQNSSLKLQLQNTGSACSRGLNAREWIQKYFGKLIVSAEWSTITTYYPGIQASEVSDLLTNIQLASASTSSTIITNVTSISIIFSSASSDLSSLFGFISSLRSQLLQDPTLTLTAKVRDSLLSSTAEALFPVAGTLPLKDWQDWLSNLNFLLLSVNSTILQNFKNDLPCSHFQSLIKTLDSMYNTLSLKRKVDIFNYEVSYLTFQTQNNGDACLPSSGDTYDFIQTNMGRFCQQGSVSDIQGFYPDVDTVSVTRYCALPTSLISVQIPE